MRKAKTAPKSDWAIFEDGKKTYLKPSVERELNNYFFNDLPFTTDMLTFTERTLEDLGIEAKMTY